MESISKHHPLDHAKETVLESVDQVWNASISTARNHGKKFGGFNKYKLTVLSVLPINDYIAHMSLIKDTLFRVVQPSICL
jgi:hypothetical protein